jgi:hypothetical protein
MTRTLCYALWLRVVLPFKLSSSRALKWLAQTKQCCFVGHTEQQTEREVAILTTTIIERGALMMSNCTASQLQPF